MEKLITKRNIFIASGLGILLIILAYFFLLNSNKESEKYFDIYLGRRLLPCAKDVVVVSVRSRKIGFEELVLRYLFVIS